MTIYCACQGIPEGQDEAQYQLWLNWYDTAWAGNTHVRNAGVTTSPALASFGGVWCARNVNNAILVDVYDPLTKTWAGDSQIDGAWIAQSPALALTPQGNRLVCLYQALGIGGDDEGKDTGRLFYSFYNPSGTWSTPANALKATTGDAAVMTLSPTLCVFNGTLYCLFQGPNFDGNLWYTTSPDGISSWTKPQQAKTSSGAAVRLSFAPSAVVRDRTLYCFMQGEGPGADLEYTTTTDGTTWTENQRVTPQDGKVLMSESPSAVVVGSTIYVFHHGVALDPGLWYTTSSDGQAWTKETPVPDVKMSASPAACVL